MATKKKSGKKATKKSATSKKTAKKAGRRPRGRGDGAELRVFDTSDTNDNISRLLRGRGLVPERFRDSPAFLDVISWNIRWFDHKDPDRVKAITEVLSELSADVFVFSEIAKDGALDEVIEALGKRKAGYYSTFYGEAAGGIEQRVVFAWDRDWVRAKDNPVELFGDENLMVRAEFGGGKARVFPRLPVWGYFEATGPEEDSEGFTFELVGVHLKAQGPSPRGYNGPAKRWGIPQRTAAAERLARWLETPGEHFDEDVLIIGDWNAKASEVEWETLRRLERDGQIDFEAINPDGDITHMARLNKSGPGGTRLDLHVLTEEAARVAVPANKGLVVQWSLFDHLDALDSQERRDAFKVLKQRFSDHLPVLTRFYFTDAAGD